MRFRNRVFLITGGTSGIGKATVELAIAEGAQVAVMGRNQEQLSELADKYASTLLPLQCDVTNLDELKQSFSKCIAHFGKLDVLVNVAGIIQNGTIENTKLEDFQYMMNVNVTAVFNLMQMAIPHLEKVAGNIVNVSSVVGTRSFPGILSYSVSKSAVDQLTKCSSMELAPKKIRVNAVNPGVVVSNLHKRGGMNEEAYSKFLEHGKTTHPIGRVGEPNDIAKAILYLASDDAGWVTGVTLNIDGGRHLTCAR